MFADTIGQLVNHTSFQFRRHRGRDSWLFGRWSVMTRLRFLWSRMSRPVGTVDRFGLEQREPEVRHALQEPLELGLVAHVARQRGVARGSRERHAVEGEPELVAQLSFDDQPIVPVSHTSEDRTLARARMRGIARRSPG